jgi:2-C-methyl-D-erythritol 4-phosphate cytidylyltransferase
MDAVVVAAGSGQRFGGEKLFLPISGLPILGWSLQVFEDAPSIRQVVVVLSDGNVRRGQALIERLGYRKIVATCIGGARRQDSVLNGVQALSGSAWVAIHDGARPFLTVDLIERGVVVARDIGAAIAAVPVKDTVKMVESANLIERTPSRSHLWAAQTPQIFQRAQLLQAYQDAGPVDVTDDAELIERLGLPVAVYMGSYENIKVTTPEDLWLARAIARQRRRDERAGG